MRLRIPERMFFTMFLLGIPYLFFLAVLSYSGTFSIFMIIFIDLFIGVQYFYSDKMVLWTTGVYIVAEIDTSQLHRIITGLCTFADLPKPQIAIVRTEVSNALATCRSSNKEFINIATGILDKLSPAELEAVLAHEITHVKNKDMTVMAIASFISTVAFYFVFL